MAIKKFPNRKNSTDLRRLGTGHVAYIKHYSFPTSNMADDLVQADEQEIQEFFDAAVNVAKQAGQVIHTYIHTS